MEIDVLESIRSAIVGTVLEMTVPMENSCPTQLISGDGEFNAAGLRDFINSVKLHQCGLSYAIVAITGPQSSGKSTLLNHLFYTNFREMDAFRGRSQTTKGVWIAKAVGIEPFTMVGKGVRMIQLLKNKVPYLL